MTFVPLVQAWEASRQERTPMPGHRRVASIEYGDSAATRPPTFFDWLPDRDEQETDDADRDDADRDDAGIDDEEREVGA